MAVANQHETNLVTLQTYRFKRVDEGLQVLLRSQPVHVKKDQSGIAGPPAGAYAELRWCGEKRSVSTPRATTRRLRNPCGSSSPERRLEQRCCGLNCGSGAGKPELEASTSPPIVLAECVDVGTEVGADGNGQRMRYL